ncbi:hypothetical protein BH09MYX1_BH09MYX1_36470 [soil metagenome]
MANDDNPPRVLHLWTLLCAGIQQNPDTRALSLMDLVDRIAVRVDATPTSTAIPIEVDWMVVSSWRRDGGAPPEVVRQRVLFEGPLFGPAAPPSVMVGEADVNLAAGHLATAAIKVRSLTLHGQGQYMFRVERRIGARWDRVGPPIGSAGLWVDYVTASLPSMDPRDRFVLELVAASPLKNDAALFAAQARLASPYKQPPAHLAATLARLRTRGLLERRARGWTLTKRGRSALESR